MELLIDRLDSALGKLLVVSDGQRLCALDYADYETRMLTLLKRRYSDVRWQEMSNPQGFSTAIRAYLAGDVASIDDIPTNPGGTDFQRQVWSALRTIPAGAVRTYSEVAARLKRPTAYRAVGRANALNPIAIIIPCHRLVGTNGALTGYAGGLERKRWLLQHEGVQVTNETVQTDGTGWRVV